MSASFEVARGTKFLLDGRTVVFKGHFPGKEEPYVFVDEDRFPITLSHEEVRRARDADELRDWTEPSAAVVHPGEVVLRARKTYASATDRERDEVQRRQAYIGGWIEAGRPPRTERGLSPVIAAVHARRVEEAAAARRYEPSAPSVRRLQQFLQKYLDTGEHVDALVPQTRLRGNYRRRLASTALSVIHDLIDSFYLKTEKPSVAKLSEQVGKEIGRVNKSRPGETPIPAPSYEAVAREVAGLCKYTVMFCREGEQAANTKFRLIGSGLITKRANEVWEIDDTRVDLICLHEDRKTPIGRPWMTVVIDRHTRMIMSFVLSFSPPDTETALEAMRLAIRRKDPVRTGNPAREVVWPAEGHPEEVHVDNGKQYNSTAFKRGVTQLGIQHKTLPLLKPWYKGTVERLIGTTMRQVFHLVPGTTHANIFERDGERPPEVVAEATLADAQEQLLRWVVTEYQHRHHKGIAKPPFAMWRESVAQHPLRLPPTATQIDSALSVTSARCIRHGVIKVDGLNYLTPHGLRLEMAPGRGTSQDIIVRRDASDLTHILFLDAAITDPSREEWHEAFISAEHRHRVEGRTLLEYRLVKQLRANNRADGIENPDWDGSFDAAGYHREKEAASRLLGKRRRAEGQRERMMKQAERRLQDEVSQDTPDNGEDLQARLEGSDILTAPTEALPAAPPPADPAPQQDTGDITPRFRVRDNGDDR